MIRLKRIASRYGRRLSGSVAWSTTLSTPSSIPPSVAPTRLPIPPSTMAMNATSVGCTPMSVDSEPPWIVSRTAATPAIAPLIANAVAIARLARTPSRRLIVKSCEAARSCTPITDRRRKSVSAAEHRERDPDREEVELADGHAADVHGLAEGAAEVHALRTRARAQQHPVLDQGAYAEGDHQQRHRVGPAEAAEGQLIHEHVQAGCDHDHHEHNQPATAACARRAARTPRPSSGRRRRSSRSAPPPASGRARRRTARTGCRR